MLGGLQEDEDSGENENNEGAMQWTKAEGKGKLSVTQLGTSRALLTIWNASQSNETHLLSSHQPHSSLESQQRGSVRRESS